MRSIYCAQRWFAFFCLLFYFIYKCLILFSHVSFLSYFLDEMYQKIGDQFIRLLSKSITLYEKECNKLGEILGLIGPFINRKGWLNLV